MFDLEFLLVDESPVSSYNAVTKDWNHFNSHVTMFYSSFTKLALMISYFEIHFRVSTEKVINSVTCILWYFYFNCTTIKTFSREQFVTWILYFGVFTPLSKPNLFCWLFFKYLFMFLFERWGNTFCDKLCLCLYHVYWAAVNDFCYILSTLMVIRCWITAKCLNRHFRMILEIICV